MPSSFVLRMAVREIRSSWQRLLFFFVCIAVGVASIVALRSVIQSVGGALSNQAREMLGADMVLSSDRVFGPGVREHLATALGDRRVTAATEATELMTMARPGTAGSTTTRMVELRAIEQAFPVRGILTVQDATYDHAMLRDRGALVRPELLAQMGIKVGDSLLIGDASFTIRGVVASEPGRNVGAFSIGPRVFIDFADLPATGLLSFGSRATHQLLLEVPDVAIDPLATEWRDAFAEEFVSVRSYRRSEDRMGENFNRAEDYLSLVGLVVLILGGIGVSSVTRVFVQQKIRSVAVLKCLGASSRQVLGIYMTQAFSLGLAGCALGVAIAAGVLAVIPAVVGDVPLLVTVDYGLTTSAVSQGAAVGLLVSLLFAAVPLLEMRHVKPSLLLREVSSSAGADWVRWAAVALAGAVLVILAVWQAGSVRVGLALVAGILGVGLVLHLAGMALIRALQPLRHTRSFALRQAVLHLARPGSQASIVLLAVGLGTFFILGVRSLQVNLLREFSVQIGADVPDMFLLDVQADQRQGVSDFIAANNEGQGPPELIPVLRARVTAVKGQKVDLDHVQDVRGRGSLAREYTVTYRAALEENEEVVDGSWWDADAGGRPEVSVEESLRDRFQIQPGDDIRFDVLGREITARVTSVRRVNWQDFGSGGFMFVFSPGTFDGAPHTFMSTAMGPRDAAARGALVGGLVAQFPNVSVIDLREMLQAVREVVANVTLGVTVVGGLVLLSGALILVGAVSMTKFRRVYEAAILKTLGASTKLIATMLVVEYGVLGAAAGIVGASCAVGLSWWLATYVLEMPWQPTPLVSLLGVLLTAAAVAVVGVVASLDVLRHKPLSTLRAE